MKLGMMDTEINIKVAGVDIMKKPATVRLQALIFAGAEEKTRTSTGKPPLDPEPSASTNSATSALVWR